MNNKESHRIVPVSAIVTVLVLVLAVFEVLLISGLLEVKSSTVARIAPWAHEPFLKMVGEHPDSAVRKHKETSATDNGTSAIDVVAGFDVLALGTNNILNIDLTEPEPDTHVPEPEKPEEEEVPEEVVPVG